MFEENKLVFELDEKIRFKITEDVLTRLKSFRQLSASDPESGGVLLGRYMLDDENVILDHITTPEAKDKGTRFSFYKQQEEHQRIIETFWSESSGTCNYLGEWHTHPEDYPVPSSTDLKTWQRQFVETVFEGDELFFIIVGRRALSVYLVNDSITELILKK